MKKYMFKTSVYLILFAIVGVNLHADTFYSSITIDTNKVKKGVVSNKLFGGFTEFLLDYINGPNGIWAQEFMDRGIDMEREDYSTSSHWNTIINDTKVYELYVKLGGYNENGRFFQYMKNYEEKGDLGIYQTITYDDTTDLDIYAYFKTEDSTTKAIVKILDENFNLLIKEYVSDLNNNWQKKSFKINKIAGHSKVIVYFGIEGKGQLSLDETSAMPSNNIHGFRKEYFDLFKNWNMGTLRWPGGSFADFFTTRWYYSIGDIDKRKTPLYGDRGYRQRMDFGLHEFMWLCDTLNIEPYLTINFYNGTIKEATDWVRYCNYDTTDSLGKLRAKNGSEAAFNVKYWEIGNEQWYNGIEYPIGYVPFYDSLYRVDSTIKFILATDLWPGKPYFDTVMTIIGRKGDIYGYHPILASIPKEPITDDDWYLNTVSLPVNFEYYIELMDDWIVEYNLKDKYMQGSTEWGLGYVDFPELLYDTVEKSSTVEAGLFYAGKLLSYIRYAEYVHMSNVTLGYGFIRRGYNSKSGKRSIVGTPAYQMYALVSRHFGDDLVAYKLTAPSYESKEFDGSWKAYQKWIDIAVTKDKDSIYIAVINKHPYDTSITSIKINEDYIPDSIYVHQFASNHYLDANTFDNPNNILPKTYKIKYEGAFNQFCLFAMNLS